jgi:hypothetical protein
MVWSRQRSGAPNITNTLDLKKASRQGSETAIRQGWHMGGIPVYGYRLVAHEHPNPH